MVFSSLPFLFAFLPITLIVYFITPHKLKNIALLIASLIFYAWGEPIYVLLMIFSSIVDYTNGRMIEKFADDRLKKKLFLIASIAVNLSLLAFFKYSGFFVQNFYELFGIGARAFHIPLPIGISFYTFQTMSYSVDVYRGEVKAEHNFLNFMTYVSMFPQLIAGPIVRYRTISAQLKERKITINDFTDGFTRLIIGLGKKVLLANQMGLLYETATGANQNSVALSWLAVIAFGFQIYFDFSGYSDMAIGIGKMLGFTYNENFNYPYIAKSLTEFWRRWHISLSSFFRDYVYIPLGGSRKNIPRNIFNLLFVWMLTGFWHGASWNFVLWGFYYGVLLIAEKYLLKNILEKLPSFLRHLYAIFFILIGWMIFAFEDLNMLSHFAASAFGFNALPFTNTYTFYILKNYLPTLLLCILLSTPLIKTLYDKLTNGVKITQNAIGIISVVAYILIFLLSTAYITDDTFNPFLYFRF